MRREHYFGQIEVRERTRVAPVVLGWLLSVCRFVFYALFVAGALLSLFGVGLGVWMMAHSGSQNFVGLLTGCACSCGSLIMLSACLAWIWDL